MARRRLALVLAAMQAGDLVVSQVLPRYGAAHLEHLGVPRRLRPLLPVIKASATLTLVGTVRRPRLRSIVGAGLVSYYAAAVTFHVRSRDPWTETAPAAVFGVAAALLV